MNKNTLFIGYGNPGRQDDGLGPALIRALEDNHILKNNEKVSLSSNYQLTVEDAYDISQFSKVVFVDASINATSPFTFEMAQADDQQSLGSHQLQPGSVLQLCDTLYDASPEAYILAIRGYEFDAFEEALSSQAQENLDAALEFTTNWIQLNA